MTRRSGQAMRYPGEMSMLEQLRDLGQVNRVVERVLGAEYSSTAGEAISEKPTEVATDPEECNQGGEMQPREEIKNE